MMKKNKIKNDLVELNKMIWIQQNLKEIIKEDMNKNTENFGRIIKVEQIKNKN